MRTPQLIATMILCLGFTAPLAADDRPNIVLMMVDDLGFSDFGCYGSQIETPNIDQLAEKGLRFAQFYNTAKCHSSRVCLLTGKYCKQAGDEKLDRAITVAEAMRSTGYFTLMTGKWHLKKQPTDRGFTRYFGHLSGATNFFTGDNTFRLNGEPWSDFDDDFYTTDANTNYAIQFIDEAVENKKPFFAYIAHNAPHYPLQAKEEDVKKYDGRFDDGWDKMRDRRFAKQLELGILDSQTAKLSTRPDYIPEWSKLTADEAKWETDRMEVFAAMVDCVDQNVGRLVDHLKRKGVYENTLILICSDNGACPFERTRGKNKKPWDPESYWCYDVGWAHAGNTPFRWYKQNQHEGGISSPLIAHWPNGLTAKQGSVTQQPGHLIDLLPTCLDVANAEMPTELDGKTYEPISGKSLLPILHGEKRNPHDYLYFSFQNNRAIRKGDWKLVSARGGRWELFDISKDRCELNDLAETHADKVAELSELWTDVATNVEKLGPKKTTAIPSDAPLKTFPPQLH
ncbi:MAG: arylsulfatase, partial [Planctomycetaceae bacterium]